MGVRQLTVRHSGLAAAAAIGLTIAACAPQNRGGTGSVASGPVRVTGTLVARAAGAEIELPDAKVFLADARGNRSGTAVTDLGGRFELAAPRSGTYSICYEINALRGCGPSVRAEEGALRTGAVAVASPGFLHGRVLTGDGRPCWAADSFFNLDVSTQVMATPRAAGASWAMSVRANTEGEYALIGLRDGDYGVTAQCEAAQAVAQVRLPDARTAATNLVLPNRAPVIRTAAAFAGGVGQSEALTGSTVDLRAFVSDPEGDTIQYIWRNLPTAGQIGGTGANVQWQLPGARGLMSAYLIARDGKGGYAFQRIDMEVMPRLVLGFAGTVISEATGRAVSGAIVSVGDSTTRTDEGGRFSLEAPPRADDRYVLNVRQGNYALASRVLDGSARDLRFEMTNAQVTQVRAGEEMRIADRNSAGFCGTIIAGGVESGRLAQPAPTLGRRPQLGEETPRIRTEPCIRRGAEISIPAGALVGPRGEPASGPVRAAVATLNPARQPLPGDYTAIRRDGRLASLVSYGAVDVQFTDSAGRELNLRRGASADIRIPVPPSQERSARPTLPMWSYDTERGRWIEEGEAVLERTADGMVYAGKTRHFSTINIDFPGWDSTNFTNITCLQVKVDPIAWGAWSNKVLRAYVDQNGSALQVQHVTLDSGPYHAVYTIPWQTGSPPNTVRLELSGDIGGTTYVLLSQIVQTDSLPQMDLSTPAPNQAFPPAPYDKCPPVELTPPTTLIPYYGVDALNRPAFLTGPYGTFNPLNPDTLYYSTLDQASGAKPTLGAWWQLNGFDANGGANGNSTYAHADYTNFNDLGFGRDMHCLVPAANKLSCYVTNYGLPDQSASNANLAAAHTFGQGGTVTMEYDLASATNPVRFYVYGGGVLTSARIDQVDLDGLGPKPVPYLCLVCHGGSYDPNNHAVLDARFREFDLPSFLYPGGKTFDDDFLTWDVPQPAIDEFAKLNKMVHDAQPLLGSQPTPIAALIAAWYPTLGSGAPQQPTPPTLWNTAANQARYHGVYAKSCRTCHIARDAGFYPYPFKVFDNPGFFNSQSVRNTVCGSVIGNALAEQRVMPNAWVTYRNFWADTALVQQFEALAVVTPTGSCGQ